MYTVEPLTPQDQNEWDAIIQQCPQTTAFQSLAWRDALASAFRQLTPVYLLIKAEDSVIGGIPAFVFQPIPGIRLWHSMPWNLFGGIHLMDSVDVNPEPLVTSVETASKENGMVRNSLDADTRAYRGLTTIFSRKQVTKRISYFTHLLKTDADVETLWHAYNKRVRGAVRKAEKSGVEVTNTNSEAALSTFYDMYLMTVQRLGWHTEAAFAYADAPPAKSR